MHSTGEVAAPGMTAGESTAVATARARVSGETTAMSASGVTAAVLRPQGHSQEERERRNGHQATHTQLL